ncbi:DUF2806 domain-containing protein [Paracoccus saliphilus]|uniref:DUF2806 domain-containing protein n=1 Tax=Paracoccus saliphilus TaxID=405559 RepID=A0AA45W7L6_9RHOB|nr:DUF2806 domain-containing protein [Paracoccus saliphilus]WCR04744.1 DUF2806 domain-containing protein [Paracoccus saliphilus]SIT10876.1 Protein of unknown function [Paracoccus saliphilus]
MSDESENWLSNIASGGLPQIIAGPAGKAISRLIGAAVDIPAAWLEVKAQAIHDEANAKRNVNNAIVDSVAQVSASDEQIIERAKNSLINKSYRTQVNKEAVARIAVGELIETPPPPESEGPSDDFMNKFERYAEDASSDDLRTLFGKILAGEVRKPGSISPFTMHFTAMLDKHTADLINRYLPYCDDNGNCYLGFMPEKISEVEKVSLEQAGFWSTGRMITFQKRESERIDVSGFIMRNKKISTFSVTERRNATVNVAILSRAGKDLVTTIDPSFNWRSAAEYLLENGVETLVVQKFPPTGGASVPSRIFARINGSIVESEMPPSTPEKDK